MNFLEMNTVSVLYLTWLNEFLPVISTFADRFGRNSVHEFSMFMPFVGGEFSQK